MRFMNEWDVQEAEGRYADHPILGPATQTLRNLVDWTNGHSDGWAYWPKPCRAAAKLQEMIERDGTSRYRFDEERLDVTLAEYKAALQPVKAFRTRQGADFEIVETTIPERLEALRAEIRAERTSYGEIAELEGLARFIPEGDVELLEWAGVPEFPEA